MLHRTMTIPRLASFARFDPVNLFRPASIAVVGLDSDASAKTLANLAVGGFKGEIHTLHSISQLPEGINLTLLALPPDQIGAAMTVMAARNCFAAIIPGEADNLREHATRTGVRALGPHSFGLAVPKLGLNATRSHIQPPPGRLAGFPVLRHQPCGNRLGGAERRRFQPHRRRRQQPRYRLRHGAGLAVARC